MRTPLIAGNWKMNGLPDEAEALLTALKAAEKGRADMLVCPPATVLFEAQAILTGTHIEWGAQNVYPAEKGAYTGEISPAMLSALGCTYAICGHSERRQLLGETDEFIRRKVAALLEAHLTPILCVGETADERAAGKTEAVIRRELEEGLAGLTPRGSDIVIAYEPVWAIGSGAAATAEDAEAVCGFIRRVLSEMLGEDADNVRILYGGSVTSANISDLLAEADIDGALVGGASLKAAEFISIYDKAKA